MKRKLTSAIWLAFGLVVILLLADAFAAPIAHDVHSPGATPVSITRFDDIPGKLDWVYGPPTQDLAAIRCVAFAAGSSQPKCDPTQVPEYPKLGQEPHTLYMVWGCASWFVNGNGILLDGYNVEWFASSRTLVLHCYTGKPWLYFPQRVYGIAPMPLRAFTLLAVPTSEMASGAIHIDEDDRLEHLIGDQSTEYQLATGTVS